MSVVDFSGQKRRDPMYKEDGSGTFYDTKKEIIQSKLNLSILDWDKEKNVAKDLSLKLPNPEDSFDYKKAIEAKTVRNKPKSINLTNFSKTRSRDENMYKTSDLLTNIELENTREEREAEIKARKE